MEGDPNICFREEAKGGRQKDITTRGGQASNLLNIALFGLYVFLHASLPFLLAIGGHALTPSLLTPCVYMQQIGKQASKQAKKETKEIRRACKDHTNKESQMGINKACKAYERENKHVIKQKRVPYEDKDRFGSSVHISIRLEYGWHTCRQAKFLKGTLGLMFQRQV